MINNLKLGLRVVKYSLGAKRCIVVGVICMVFGIVATIGAPREGINGAMFGMAAMIIAQLLCSISASTMVQSSPCKRKLQTSVPTTVCGASMLLLQTVSLIALLLGAKLNHVELEELANPLVFNAIYMVLMCLYMAGAMKVFWLATVCFTFVFLVFFHLVMVSFIIEKVPLVTLSFGASVAVSYLLLIIAIVLMYIILLATYKREIAKQNFESELKREK